MHVLVPASLCHRPWIALLRVPVTAPGQTIRVCRIGSPTCLCNAAHNAAMHALSELAVVRAGRDLARGALTVAAHLAVAETHA